MNKLSFLYKFIIFIGSFFVISQIANEIYIRNVLSYSNTYRADQQFQQNKNKIRVLVVGDSHPMAGVNPTYLPEAFVTAVGGESIIQTYYRLHYYIEKDHLQLDLVILPLDLHSFSSFRVDRIQETDWWNKYINYFELGLNKKKLGGCLLQWLNGEFAYIGGIKATRRVALIDQGARDLRIITNGHIVGYKDFSLEPDPVHKAKQRINHQLKRYDVLNKDMIHYFLKTIDLLQSHNIKVVLVRYPISNAYYRMAEEVMDIDDYYNQINGFINDYGDSLLILDYHDIYWKQKEMFNDVEHLNDQGAKNFTKKLNSDLEENGLIMDD